MPTAKISKLIPKEHIKGSLRNGRGLSDLVNRRTGRTTALVMQMAAKAMLDPHTDVTFTIPEQHLRGKFHQVVAGVLDKLGLKHFGIYKTKRYDLITIRYNIFETIKWDEDDEHS